MIGAGPIPAAERGQKKKAGIKSMKRQVFEHQAFPIHPVKNFEVPSVATLCVCRRNRKRRQNHNNSSGRYCVAVFECEQTIEDMKIFEPPA